MKKLLSLSLSALLLLILALPVSASEWTYDDFPVFPESNERSPKLPASAALTRQDTPTDAFADPNAAVTKLLFYDEDVVEANLASGRIAESEFTVSHYDREDCKYSCVTMSYYAHSPFEVKFTVEESGLYEFRFDCVTDVSGRGAYLQIDDGIYYDTYCEYKWPDEISMYGMTALLTAGEHTFKLYGHETKPVYSQGFAYTLVEAREIETDAPAGETAEDASSQTEKTASVTADKATEEKGANGMDWELYLLAGLWIVALGMAAYAIALKK